MGSGSGYVCDQRAVLWSELHRCRTVVDVVAEVSSFSLISLPTHSSTPCSIIKATSSTIYSASALILYLQHRRCFQPAVLDCYRHRFPTLPLCYHPPKPHTSPSLQKPHLPIRPHPLHHSQLRARPCARLVMFQPAVQCSRFRELLY